jgi:hypothetical protein
MSRSSWLAARNVATCAGNQTVMLGPVAGPSST